MTSHRVVFALAAALLLAPAVVRCADAKTSTPARSTAAEAHGSAMVLPFIENDLTRAMALARARKLPIFVEAWAPW